MKPWPLVIAWAALCLGIIAVIGFTENRREELIFHAGYDAQPSR